MIRNRPRENRKALPTNPQAITQRSESLASMASVIPIIMMSPLIESFAPGNIWLELLDLSIVVTFATWVLVQKTRLTNHIARVQPAISGFFYKKWGLTINYRGGDQILLFAAVLLMAIPVIRRHLPMQIASVAMAIGFVACAIQSWRVAARCPLYQPPRKAGFPVMEVSGDETLIAAADAQALEDDNRVLHLQSTTPTDTSPKPPKIA